MSGGHVPPQADGVPNPTKPPPKPPESNLGMPRWQYGERLLLVERNPRAERTAVNRFFGTEPRDSFRGRVLQQLRYHPDDMDGQEADWIEHVVHPTGLEHGPTVVTRVDGWVYGRTREDVNLKLREWCLEEAERQRTEATREVWDPDGEGFETGTPIGDLFKTQRKRPERQIKDGVLRPERSPEGDPPISRAVPREGPRRTEGGYQPTRDPGPIPDELVKASPGFSAPVELLRQLGEAQRQIEDLVEANTDLHERLRKRPQAISHAEAQELHRIIGQAIEIGYAPGDDAIEGPDMVRAREIAALLVSDTLVREEPAWAKAVIVPKVEAAFTGLQMTPGTERAIYHFVEAEIAQLRAEGKTEGEWEITVNAEPEAARPGYSLTIRRPEGNE